MDRTPLPVSLSTALALPRTPGRSAEVFIDGDLELRFSARPTNGPQVPHQRDELYFVAAGTGHCFTDRKNSPRLSVQGVWHARAPVRKSQYAVIPGRGHSPRARKPGTHAHQGLAQASVHGFRA